MSLPSPYKLNGRTLMVYPLIHFLQEHLGLNLVPSLCTQFVLHLLISVNVTIDTLEFLLQGGGLIHGRQNRGDGDEM